MGKYDVSKFKLKFDKPREKQPQEDTSNKQEDTSVKVDTAQKAAKKRWWEISNLGAKIGSNKKSIFDKKE